MADDKELKDLGLEGGLPPEMTAATGAPRSGGTALGGTELEDLDDKDSDDALKLCRQKFNDVPLGGTIPIRASEYLVVLGSDYGGNVENYMKRMPGREAGKLTKVSNPFKKLKSLKVEGISSAANRATVKELLELLLKDVPA